MRSSSQVQDAHLNRETYLKKKQQNFGPNYGTQEQSHEICNKPVSADGT